jgi:hypothetical protein
LEFGVSGRKADLLGLARGDVGLERYDVLLERLFRVQ